MRKIVAVVALASLTLAGPSFAIEKGSSLLSIGVFQGTADLVGPESGFGGISAFQSPEIGVGGEYWQMFSDDYALTIQGSYGFSSETNKPGTNAAAGSLEQKFSTTSFKFRVGGDRVGHIGERFVWFMGPGLEYWSGKAKFENGAGGGFVTTASTAESEATSRFGINGRVGGIMMMSDAWGIQGQVGHTLGYASAEEAGAKATWYPSSFNASWGLLFAFGGATE